MVPKKGKDGFVLGLNPYETQIGTHPGLEGLGKTSAMKLFDTQTIGGLAGLKIRGERLQGFKYKELVFLGEAFEGFLEG